MGLLYTHDLLCYCLVVVFVCFLLAGFLLGLCCLSCLGCMFWVVCGVCRCGFGVPVSFFAVDTWCALCYFVMEFWCVCLNVYGLQVARFICLQF